jgi:hypothetical protein
MKEKLELLQQDALEAKVQAFPEIAKYEWDDISVIRIGLPVIATGICIRYMFPVKGT